jgi:hypothetical protein
LLERGVESAVLNCDADVAGERFEQFNVFTRQEVTVDGFAESEEGDGLLPRVARDVIVQIEASDGLLCSGIFARLLMRVFEEDMSRGILDAGLGQER